MVTDVDECGVGAVSCHANATCINKSPGYCCQCNEGFYGNGITCTEIGMCCIHDINNQVLSGLPKPRSRDDYTLCNVPAIDTLPRSLFSHYKTADIKVTCIVSRDETRDA